MGRSYGTTNMIVLDRDGNQLPSLDTTVAMGGSKNVQVYKAGTRMTYNCSPECEVTMQIGDRADYSEGVTTQISGRADAAAGGAKASSE
jgi:hypothetical protein